MISDIQLLYSVHIRTATIHASLADRNANRTWEKLNQIEEYSLRSWTTNEVVRMMMFCT